MNDIKPPPRSLWQNIRYMPEFVGALTYFTYPMSVPVFEQYYFKHYSDKFGYNWSLSDSSARHFKKGATDPILIEVQDAVSKFLATNSICLLVPSIIFGLLYGPFSDCVGRKPIMFLNMSGFLVMTASAIVVDIFKLDLWLIQLGSVFFGIGGYLSVTTMIVQVYMSDVVKGDRLPVRLGLLNMASFAALSANNFTNGFLLRKLGFLKTFIFMAALAVFSGLLVAFQLAESLPKRNRATAGDLLQVPKRIWLLLKVRRPHKWRLYFLIPLEAFGNIVQESAVMGILLLRLLNIPFDWSPIEIGVYRGTLFLVAGVGSAILIYLLPKLIHKGFTIIAAYLSASTFCLIFGTATTKARVFLAIVGGLFMNSHTPMCRAILANTVNDNEKGSLFGLMNVLASTILLICSYIYQWAYRVGNDRGNPGGVFYGIACTILLPIIPVLCYIVKDKNDERRKIRSSTTVPSPLGHIARESDPLLG